MISESNAPYIEHLLGTEATRIGEVSVTYQMILDSVYDAINRNERTTGRRQTGLIANILGDRFAVWLFGSLPVARTRIYDELCINIGASDADRGGQNFTLFSEALNKLAEEGLLVVDKEWESFFKPTSDALFFVSFKDYTVKEQIIEHTNDREAGVSENTESGISTQVS